MQHPDCPLPPAECRITVNSYIAQPAIAWTPEYDGAGQMLNSDPNTFITDYACAVCSGAWRETRAAPDAPQITVLRYVR